MKNLTKYSILGLAVAAFVSTASAIPTLTINDGFTTVTVTDNGVGDIIPTLGNVTWAGVIGVWDINLDSGLTKPAVGGVLNPQLDLLFQAHSTAAGTLTLTFSENGFGPLLGGLSDLIGGTTPGTVADYVYEDNGVIASITGLTGAFSGSTSTGPISIGSTNVLAIQVVITHTAAGLTTGNKDVSFVPDGGTTVLLLGAALSGLAWVNSRRKS